MCLIRQRQRRVGGGGGRGSQLMKIVTWLHVARNSSMLWCLCSLLLVVFVFYMIYLWYPVEIPWSYLSIYLSIYLSNIQTVSESPANERMNGIKRKEEIQIITNKSQSLSLTTSSWRWDGISSNLLFCIFTHFLTVQSATMPVPSIPSIPSIPSTNRYYLQ